MRDCHGVSISNLHPLKTSLTLLCLSVVGALLPLLINLYALH